MVIKKWIVDTMSEMSLKALISPIKASLQVGKSETLIGIST